MAPNIAPVSAVITENGLRHRSKARGLLNASNLPALQNLIKRDPKSYTEEFRSQWNHYESLRRIYASNTGIDGSNGIGGSVAAESKVADAGGRGTSKEQEDKFVALLAFVTQLAPSYPSMTAPLFQQISSLLLEHHSSIGREVRSSCVKSLVLLRNRDVISSEQLLQTLFPLLLASPSSSLRSLLQNTITTDLRNANAKAKNHSLNRVVQGLLFSVVEVGMPNHGDDGGLSRAGYGKREAGVKSGSEALWAVRLAAELWKKRIWNDEKTVSLLALACLHPHPRVQSSAIRFFLGDLHSAEAGEESGSENESGAEGGEIPDVKALLHRRKINKKTRSNDKKVRAAASLAKKRRKALEDKKAEADGQNGNSNVAAIHLLHDPQGFGEKLFDELRKGDKRLAIEAKVRIMQLLARIMSCHQCSILGLYTFVIKYLNPHQTHITLILVSIAQSVHTQTPPSSLLPLIRKLAHNFVHPGVGPEVVAAGINTIREICSRQIWALGTEEDEYDEEENEKGNAESAKTITKPLDDGKDLLEDLITYRRSKDKGVAAASRGLLQLYRRENPSLLPRKERGKDGSMKVDTEGFESRGFGEDTQTTKGIVGLDLLEKALEEEGEDEEEDEEERDKAAWEGWDEDSANEDSDASSQGWIDVSSEGEDFEVSDSDDEDGKSRKEKKKEEDDKKTPGERVRERRLAKREVRRLAREKGAKADGADQDEEDDDDDNEEEKSEADDVQAKEDTIKEEEARMSTLATTRILTPADFARLNQLRIEAAQAKLEAAKTGSRSQQAIKKEIKQLEAQRKRSHGGGGDDDGKVATLVGEVDILGLRKKRKMDYEERMAHIEKGREGREAFGSKKGKKNKEKMSSSNNQVKKKSKPFSMIAKSWSVRSKKNASLTDKSRRLRAAKEKQKKQYK